MSGLKDFVQNNLTSYLPQEDSSYGPDMASLKAKDNRGTSYIGCFATPEEAQLAVKEEKLRYTKSLIREYRRFLPKQVQDNILYKVEHYDDT